VETRLHKKKSTVNDRGFYPREVEHPTNLSGKSPVSQTGGAESGAVDAPGAGLTASGATATDPALARLVEAWPGLPEHIRAAILSLVATAVVPSARSAK
jgi:hypothetical protein